MARVFITNGGGAGGAGGIETIANVGTGTGLIYAGGTNPANLREIKAGANIGVATIANDVVVSFTGTIPTAATAENVGAGDQVYVTGSDLPFNFRTLVAGTDIGITQSADELLIDFTGTIPAAATAQNIGTGDEVYVTGSDTPFDFRTLVAGTDIGITQSASELLIDFTGTIPAAATAQNVGTGDADVYVTGSANPFDFRALVAGTNMTITEGVDTITFDAAGGGGGGNLQVKNGVPLDATLRAIADNPADTSSEIEIATNKTQIDTMLVGRGLNKSATNSGVGANVFANTTTASECTAVGYNALNNLTIGDHNTAIGNESGIGLTSGGANTLVGSLVGTSLGVGNNNTAVGFQALQSCDSDDNTAVGFQSLNALAVGAKNTSIGFQAGLSAGGDENTFVGFQAGASGGLEHNTFIGYIAGGNLTNGSRNVGVGHSALDLSTNANDNVAVGQNALGGSTTGSRNIGIGTNAGTGIVTTNNNIAIGIDALSTANLSQFNIAIGHEAMQLANFNANYNTAVGYQALQSVNDQYGSGEGQYNTALGYQAGKGMNNRNHCTFIGANTGAQTTQLTTYCVVVGSQAASLGSGGNYNVVMGYAAARNMVSDNNVIIGANAMGNSPQNYVINNNVVIGQSAGSSIQGGTTDNVVIGYAAAQNLSGTSGQIFIGSGSGTAVSSGTENTCLGYNTMQAATSASDNVVIGYNAGFGITTGIDNVIIGSGSGAAITSGSSNVVIGKSIDANATGNNNTLIGKAITNLGTNNNTIIGSLQNGGGFNGLTMIGISDTATANGQMRFGSASSPAGSTAVSSSVSSKYWNVFINGVAERILLA
jgi:hypothetical protein